MLKLHHSKKLILSSLIIVSVICLSIGVVAIENNNPNYTTEEQSFTGTIISVNDQTFEFTSDDINYIVHVPQYVNISLLNLESDQSVEVTGYLKVTSCNNVIYPTVINGIVLEDLKPLDGSGKI